MIAYLVALAEISRDGLKNVAFIQSIHGYR
ncbi:hypothetical protein EMIT0324P_11526 [Pseudomonas chlororaphis]